MKILLANSYLYPRGGDCTYTLSLAHLLKTNGHEVRFFSMNHPKNLACTDSKYFVDYTDFSELNENKGLISGINVLKRNIYSVHSRKRLREMLRTWKPDVAHLQNIHGHITPSILDEFIKNRIPIVWTLHDFKMLCPNTHFLSQGDNCESCNKGRYYYCFLKHCKKDSRLASLVATIEAYVHNFIKIKEKVDAFIAPSSFIQKKFIEYGWPSEKMHHIQNFVPEFFRSNENISRYALYFGQLAPWKGIRTLLHAAHESKIPLVIAGEGPLQAELASLRESLNMHHVKMTGFLERPQLDEVIKQAAFVVIPSECYENSPYSAMEAMAHGKPILGASIGGIPELVHNGKTGLLFKPGKIDDLAGKMAFLWEHPHEAQGMGQKALTFAKQAFDPKKHLTKVTRVYSSIYRLH